MLQKILFRHLKLSSHFILPQKRISSLRSIDLATALQRFNDFHYRGDVVSGWSVGTVPNGGYLMMMAILAAKNCVEHPDPLSVTAYYVARGFENVPADIKMRIVAKSKNSTSVHITFSQESETKSEYLAIFGDLTKSKGISFNHKAKLDFPKRDECINVNPILQTIEKHVSYFNKIDVLMPKNDPFMSGHFQGKIGDKAELNCWTRFTENRKPCLPSLAFFLDALTPPIINLKPSKWVPTMQYTVHFWNKLDNGQVDDIEIEEFWLRERLETFYSRNGILHIDSEIWSADGENLLATSRQMARLMEPK